MRIRLKVDLPVGECHDCKAGNEYDTEYTMYCADSRRPRVLFVAASGAIVSAWPDEYDIVNGEHE